MVRKYFLQQLGLLLMVSVIMVLTNILGYKMPVGDYVSLTGLLLACPISPVKDFVIGVTSQVAFMAPATALGAFAGISLGKDLKDFAKMGWKLVIITLFVITGTFIFSALVADVILKLTGAI